MKRLGKILLVIVMLLMIPAAGIAFISYSQADLDHLPALESGDLIFQSPITPQTAAIVFATGSSYSHVGVVHKVGDTLSVIHAGRHVMESPLKTFLRSGWGQQFTIMRYKDLKPEQREAIASNAEHYLGHPYNYVFHMGTDAVYCSELPYLAFKQSGVALGNLQKISELNMNNFAVRKLFNERWKMHPACQAADMTADRCWGTIMEEPIITPVQLSRDSHLTILYSNYWF